MSLPRRFGYVFEFDRNGGPAAGDPLQQAFIREVINRYATAGSKFDRILHALATKAKMIRHFIPVTFADEMVYNGQAWPYLIMLNSRMTVGPFLEFVFLHEVGHVVAMQLLNPADRSETWADLFAVWVQQGSPDDPTIETRIEGAA